MGRAGSGSRGSGGSRGSSSSGGSRSRGSSSKSSSYSSSSSHRNYKSSKTGLDLSGLSTTQTLKLFVKFLIFIFIIAGVLILLIHFLGELAFILGLITIMIGAPILGLYIKIKDKRNKNK